MDRTQDNDLKPIRKIEIIERIYWECNIPEHRHKTEKSAMKVRYLPPQKKNMCGGSGMDLTRQVVALKIVGSIPTRHPKLNRRIYERSLPHV